MIIKKEIHRIHIANWEEAPIAFKIVPKDLLPDDELVVRYCEGLISENNCYDPSTKLIITRMVEETPEEESKRLARKERTEKSNKNLRYESYLRLKREFDPEN